MKRIMVCLGFGSLMIFVSTFSSKSLIQADTPVSVSALGAPPVQMESQVVWHTDLQSGWLEAQRRGLPMMIFITTDNCMYCDAMKRDTWCNRSVQSRLAGKFVAIRLTPKRNQKTLKRIHVPAYPTTLVGIPKGKIVGHRIGYQPPAELHAFIAEIAAHAEQMNPKNIH